MTYIFNLFIFNANIYFLMYIWIIMFIFISEYMDWYKGNYFINELKMQDLVTN